MAKRIQSPEFISFKGTYVFPKLHEPDYGNKDFPKPDGAFSVKLRGQADDKEVKALLAKLQPYHDAAVEQGEKAFKGLKPDVRKKLGKVTVQPLFATVYDEDEEETGEIDLNFNMPYSGVFKKGPKEGQHWYRAPDIFDAKGNKLPYFTRDKKTGVITPNKGAPSIWGGTVGRIAFELGMNKEGSPGYFIPGTGLAGLSLKLKAVRIIKLVSGGARSASDYGFEDEEGDDLSNQFAPDDETAAQETTKGADEGSVDASVDDDNPDF